MTDNEIIKALECCSTATCITNKCPYESICDIPTCTTKLTKDALDLIKRQKAEIERLEFERASDHEKLKQVSVMLKGLKGDIEHDIKLAKAEAVKEFVQRLKKKLIDGGLYPVFVKNKIAETEKEMVGANNGSE